MGKSIIAKFVTSFFCFNGKLVRMQAGEKKSRMGWVGTLSIKRLFNGGNI
jgi:hypothetical protein